MMTYIDADYERGRRIAEYRKKQNMSQDELADAADISRPSMSKIENGGDFKVSNLMNLVSALGVTPMQILLGEDNGKEALIDDILGELNSMEENELRVVLGAIRGAKNAG